MKANEILKHNLPLLTKIAQSSGVEGIFVIREAEGAVLFYEANGEEVNLDLDNPTDGMMLVILRFPVGDGGLAGLQIL